MCFLVSASGAKRDRAWVPATVVDFSRDKVSTGASATNDSYGNTTIQEHYDDLEQFVIETADRVYVVSDEIQRVGGTVSFRLRKGSRLTAGSAVKIAIEKQTAYILDEKGKEHKLQLRRIQIKSIQR
jgi:hypothetical protein